MRWLNFDWKLKSISSTALNFQFSPGFPEFLARSFYQGVSGTRVKGNWRVTAGAKGQTVISCLKETKRSNDDWMAAEFSLTSLCIEGLLVRIADPPTLWKEPFSPANKWIELRLTIGWIFGGSDKFCLMTTTFQSWAFGSVGVSPISAVIFTSDCSSLLIEVELSRVGLDLIKSAWALELIWSRLGAGGFRHFSKVIGGGGGGKDNWLSSELLELRWWEEAESLVIGVNIFCKVRLSTLMWFPTRFFLSPVRVEPSCFSHTVSARLTIGSVMGPLAILVCNFGLGQFWVVTEFSLW